jgi:hypothetical protein
MVNSSFAGYLFMFSPISLSTRRSRLFRLLAIENYKASALGEHKY